MGDKSSGHEEKEPYVLAKAASATGLGTVGRFLTRIFYWVLDLVLNFSIDR